MKKKEKVESEAAAVTPKVVPLESKVERNVDFNLKKEDLMLLILEGRKEAMEEVIAKLQNQKNKLFTVHLEKQEEFEKAVRKELLTALLPIAQKMAKTYNGNSTGDDENLDNSISIRLNSYSKGIKYTLYKSAPIGDSKNSGTYIKTEAVGITEITLFDRVSYNLTLNFSGTQYLKKNALFKNEDPRGCAASPQSFRIGEEYISEAALENTDAYKALLKATIAYNECNTQLSEITTEYDLFSRNQSRAKASMIKEVLGRDEQGKALLTNIAEAAKGIKLLGS